MSFFKGPHINFLKKISLKSLRRCTKRCSSQHFVWEWGISNNWGRQPKLDANLKSSKNIQWLTKQLSETAQNKHPRQRIQEASKNIKHEGPPSYMNLKCMYIKHNIIIVLKHVYKRYKRMSELFFRNHVSHFEREADWQDIRVKEQHTKRNYNKIRAF